MLQPAAQPRRLVLCVRVLDMPVPALEGDHLGSCIECGLPVRFRPYMAGVGEKVCTVCVGLLAAR